MIQTIDIQLSFNTGNEEVNRFVTSFQEDLSLCLKRFNVNPVYSQNSKNIKGITLLFLSFDDLHNPDFLSYINAFNDFSNVYLLNLDPVKESDGVLNLHKFQLFRLWDEVIETGEIRLFRRSNHESLSSYWEKITDITIEIFEKLFARNTQLSKPRVYLAQTDTAQNSSRDNLKRDITELGFEVLPEKTLSPIFEECTNQITEYLKGCSLIIHPIPLVYTKYFQDKNISIVEHQCDISAQYLAATKQSNKRIIWIPSDLDIVDEGNQIFVEKIQRDQEQAHNSTVLKVSLEELKKIYRRILSGKEDESLKNESTLPDIYLIADEEQEDVNKLMKFKASNGHKLGFNYKGITYNQHLKNLANAQVVVINYTSDNKEWFSVKVNEILKSPGLNIARPFKRLILVKGNPELDTCNLDNYFSEVYTGSLDAINLNLEVKTK